MKNKVLVLGMNGLIGSNLFRCLKLSNEIDIYGTFRTNRNNFFYDGDLIDKKIYKCDVFNYVNLLKIIQKIKPNFVINCIGLTKHYSDISSELMFEINAKFPQKLAKSSNKYNYKLIHISTDCIYSGERGMYMESEPSDAIDNYGRSKAEGEKLNINSLILRTSTIGHEYYSNNGLLNWFLSRNYSCVGYKKAIFSGLPTNIFSDVVKNIIMDYPNLYGLYNIAAEPIDKYSLLKMIANVYKKNIYVTPDNSFKVNRSLDGNKFNSLRKSRFPSWEILIKSMYDNNQKI